MAEAQTARLRAWKMSPIRENLSKELRVQTWKEDEAGSIPHPVMGTIRNYCRDIKGLLTPCLGAITLGWIDLVSPRGSANEIP